MKRKILLIFSIFFTLAPVHSTFAAIVNASYSVQDLILTYVDPAAVDTYGIGIHGFDLNADVTVSYTYDNNYLNASSVYIDSDYNYEFVGSPYGTSLNVNGTNVLNTSYLEVTIMNNSTIVPSGGVPQDLIDAGFPQIPSTGDAVWIGGYSDDHVYGPENGLVFFVQGMDFSSSWLTDDQTIPALPPDDANLDFTFLAIEQYDNGNLMFSAVGIVANNISTVPVPAAFWLFGSGLLGMIGIARINIA